MTRRRRRRLPRIDIGHRDVDVPLSGLGATQSDALGRWFAAMPANARPDVLLVSPYLRARQTAERIIGAGGLAPDASSPIADERLRRRSSASWTA